MKTLFFLFPVLLALFLMSCDGSSVVTVNPDGTLSTDNLELKRKIKEKKQKDSLAQDSLRKTLPVVSFDTIVADTTVIGPDIKINMTTTSVKAVDVEPEKDVNNVITNKLNEIEVKTRNPDFKLKASTYKVRRYEQVSEILSLLYEQKLNSLKKAGVPSSVISAEYTKFFSIEYCDDRVLEFLDELCKEENQKITNKFIIDYDAIFENKDSRVVIKKKK